MRTRKSSARWGPQNELARARSLNSVRNDRKQREETNARTCERHLHVFLICGRSPVFLCYTGKNLSAKTLNISRSDDLSIMNLKIGDTNAHSTISLPGRLISKTDQGLAFQFRMTVIGEVTSDSLLMRNCCPSAETEYSQTVGL